MKYVRLLDTTAIKECDDGALVINTETGENFYVNKTGLLFLRALDGTVQKADSVISMLLSQFDKISEDDFSHDFFDLFYDRTCACLPYFVHRFPWANCIAIFFFACGGVYTHSSMWLPRKK